MSVKLIPMAAPMWQALRRLFEECCGAEVCPGIVDVYPAPTEAVSIVFRPSRARSCRATIDDDFMFGRLSRLGCAIGEKIYAKDGSLVSVTVTVPTNRPDLTRGRSD